MKPGLLLIDLQHDFLDRKGLVPPPNVLVREVQKLLGACRELGLPVIHVHTQVNRDGNDRMPHWKRDNTWACVEGTTGVQSPEALRPQADEALLVKQYLNAFGSSNLIKVLQKKQIDTLIVAGLYLHACVRSAVLEAYERGFNVWIAEDAVGSCEPAQAELARIYLEGRAATFLGTAPLLEQLGLPAARNAVSSPERLVPVASIAGRWVANQSHRILERRNPTDWNETLAWVPIGTHAEVNLAGSAAATAQSDWKRVPAATRATFLENWADALAAQAEHLAKLLACEIGKPLAEGREEVSRGIAHVRSAIKLCGELSGYSLDSRRAVGVRFQPHGVVGLITPWNNPIAIPAGKIAPALALGNGVLWKPAVEAPRSAMAVINTLQQAGFPVGLVNLVFGDAATARRVIDCPDVAAVSLTGAIASGNSAYARCVSLGKPLQAELGGNNAAIVLSDCEITSTARSLAYAAFSFAGQRCTALRRIIVERCILEPFCQSFVDTTQSLRIGDPCDPATEIGPLISWNHRKNVQEALEQARSDEAQVLCGGIPPSGMEHGCWLKPAIVSNIKPAARLAQMETFGPVAVILPAADLEEALEIANGVEHGLVAALYSQNENNRRRFAEVIQAGILKFSPEPLSVHPDAPFGGWNASGIGPPEHGLGDRQFYSRPQVTYGWSGAIESNV